MAKQTNEVVEIAFLVPLPFYFLTNKHNLNDLQFGLLFWLLIYINTTQCVYLFELNIHDFFFYFFQKCTDTKVCLCLDIGGLVASNTCVCIGEHYSYCICLLIIDWKWEECFVLCLLYDCSYFYMHDLLHYVVLSQLSAGYPQRLWWKTDC